MQSLRYFGNRFVSKAPVLAILVILAVLAGACLPNNSNSPAINGNSSNKNDSNEPLETVSLDETEPLAALRSFDHCSTLLDYLRTETVKRVGPYGLADERYFRHGITTDFAETDDAPSTDIADSATRRESASSQPASDLDSFSETNVQVEGVDEPDIIKTDGKRILVIANERLHYVDLSSQEPTYRGSVKIGASGWGYEILMHQDRALIFTNSYEEVPRLPSADAINTAEIAKDIAFDGGSQALIQEIDLSDPSNMAVIAKLRVEGQYLNARSVGNTAWLSLSSNPLQFAFVHPSGPSALDVAEQVNKDIAAKSELDAWLPAYRLENPEGTTTGLLPDCANLHIPADFSGFTVLSVLTLNIEQPLNAQDATAVLADGHTLYSSAQALYLATSERDKLDEPANENQNGDDILTPRNEQWRSEWLTTVHKFSISQSGPARYEASGEVYGHLLNQFSMDEHNGYFRIATTIGEPWNTENSQSQVVVLQQQGRRLAIVGSVGGLGKGERIYSVRYAGDVGYVVTFREVDPLYVIDLSNPMSPSVKGELKIPGFSTYLHPLGDGLLAGIGQQTDNRGRTQGTKVSLFDVSNPAEPTELDFLVFADAHSEAEWDHRAFLHWPKDELLVLPLNQQPNSPEISERESSATTQSSSSPTSRSFIGAVLLQANRDGIAEIGRITHRRPQTNFTGCRPAKKASLTDWLTEANEIHICPSALKVTHPGFHCDTWNSTSAAKQWPELRVSPTEKLYACWLRTPSIQRLLITNDALWSMTHQAIQANDLKTLDYETQFYFRTN